MMSRLYSVRCVRELGSTPALCISLFKLNSRSLKIQLTILTLKLKLYVYQHSIRSGSGSGATY